MKKQLLLIVTLAATFTSSFAFAVQRNPQIRTCNQLGGEFVAANTHDDQIGFCRFDQALIGALDLTLFNNKESISQSINNYTKGVQTCTGSIETLIVVGTSDSLQACRYSDGSYIELGTLIKGSGSADNSKLNEVLGL